MDAVGRRLLHGRPRRSSPPRQLFVLYPSERGPGGGHAVGVVVPAAPGAPELADILAAAGVIDGPRVFALWARVAGTGAVVPGSHLLSDDASPRQLLARLERMPGGGGARVTFPEGWNRFDMVRAPPGQARRRGQPFLDATTDASLLRELGIDGDSAEGFLFPATYDLALDSDPRDVVRRMKREFDHRWDVLSRGPAPGASTTVMTLRALRRARRRDLLASMVEKEAAVDDERATIASVFLNRLRDPSFHPKLLQSDPTAAYGCLIAPEKAPSCAGFSGKPAAKPSSTTPATRTRRTTNEGLPPGPITNPGDESGSPPP